MTALSIFTFLMGLLFTGLGWLIRRQDDTDPRLAADTGAQARKRHLALWVGTVVLSLGVAGILTGIFRWIAPHLYPEAFLGYATLFVLMALFSALIGRRYHV